LTQIREEQLEQAGIAQLGRFLRGLREPCLDRRAAAAGDREEPPPPATRLTLFRQQTQLDQARGSL